MTNNEYMNRSEILKEAEKCISGKREQDYGKPENNFEAIAKLWSDWLEIKIEPLDVAMMMILLKTARVKGGGGTGDNFVDICGYGAIAGELYHNSIINIIDNTNNKIYVKTDKK